MTSSNLASSKESAKPEAELLPFHPSADVFDLMDGQEFEELAADIERRGLRIPIITYKGQIIDGRNRARACAKAGVPARYEEFTGTDEEVERFIISMNIHRRHLKAEERRAKLKQLLGMHPEKSDRVIAAETGYSHTAVQKARQSTGNKLPVGGKRKGKDGIERRMPKRRGAPAISKDLDAPTMAAVRKKLLERTKRGENPSIAEVTAEVLAELKSAGTGEKPCSDCGGTGTCPTVVAPAARRATPTPSSSS
jgi:ParB-like chromosome segregation protein Spo0J